MDQSSFAAALLDADAPIPGALSAPVDGALARRFAVHRNNVVAGLVDALAARFPVVARLVGDAFFAAMARVHVIDAPPRGPVLHAWGAAFPAFLDGFPPVGHLPYLADVARLELAVGAAYHAADAVPLGADAFAELADSSAADLRLRLHPSVRVVRSPHPVATIWNAHRGTAEWVTRAEWRGEDALVRRPGADVAVSPLRPGDAAFLAALGARTALGDAVALATAAAPGFDLVAALADAIALGLVVAVERPHTERMVP